MRLLYIHQHFTVPAGTNGIRSYQMARRMVARGHDVLMVCGRGKDGQTGLSGPFRRGVRRGSVDGISIIEIDLTYSNSDGFLKRTATFIRFMMRSLRVVLTERYDVVLATTTPLTVGIPGIAARWLRRKRFVFEVRDLWPELPRAMGVIRNPVVLALLGALEWSAYRSAHRLIGLSPGIVEGIRKCAGATAEVIMVPNGCDNEIFAPDPDEFSHKFREGGGFTLIFAGAHGLANGLDSVLDAAVLLQERKREDIKFLLIGDGMCKSALQARAQADGIANVEFRPSVKKTELVAMMHAANAGLQVLADIPAFYRGTSPNKFFDYLAAGLPVLNNYPGWLAELITDANCGTAVAPRDARAFADAIEALADDPQLVREMANNSLALATGPFARNRLSDQWVEWVEGVLPSANELARADSPRPPAIAE